MQKDITVITNDSNKWGCRRLAQEAGKMKIKIEFKNINNAFSFENDLKNLGKVLLWRSANLKQFPDWATFLEMASKKSFVINHAFYKKPFIFNKFYQQEFIKHEKDLDGIESFYCINSQEVSSAIRENKICYPFVAKAPIGGHGTKVFLIKNKQDFMSLNWDEAGYLLQNYIKNDGDYRVLVLGGRAFGVMKRVAKEGEFRNNVSRGGSAYLVEDKELSEMLSTTAVRIADVFGIQMCGVDLIFDQNEKKYRFLELNCRPQWEAFEKVTKINISKEILIYCRQLIDRNYKKLPELILDYYDKSFPYLDLTKKRHYASRMFLFFKRKIDRERLNQIEDFYLPKNEKKLYENLVHIRKQVIEPSDFKQVREPFVKKYPTLGSLNAILFKVFFGQIWYGRDIRPIVKKLKIEKEFIEMRQKLLVDKQAIKVFSTRIVNFLYLIEFYFENQKEFKVDPEFFWNISEEMEENNYVEVSLKNYLLSHCIINATKFYSQPVLENKDVYLRMIKKIEETIENNFFETILDMRIEFLVCAKLIGYININEE
ncbi:MAG: hypothetical protein PHW50_02445 [Patescibacteria group bacterium]|nr:hypothetical protein [Patescibacteria group bacterium]